MSEFKKYSFIDSDKVKLRPVTSLEIIDGVEDDDEGGVLDVKEGDMIMIKGEDDDTEWLITKEYVESHFKLNE